MKKKQEPHQDEQHDVEILKAVAQAWHGHSSSRGTTTEFDAHRHNFKNKPSRFKLEAINKATSREYDGTISRWDFSQSLWDSYEILNVSKKLETGLMLDHPLDGSIQIGQKRKESKNSLRKLLNRVSSRRYNEAESTLDKDG
ncbi:uncharacterized protein [Solanum tuberosum]|uniref:Uncharacterized protein n=1 Tax=Solanum tuberosum TaxID=4113 RepID=M1BJQ4_SOLTU|nr:PREDICTED: uncharacterized protein LOC102582940 [Solanum tuberosum]KAH0686960.1 hypothetical protein KY284_017513 [Solanum tuberosum]KAH0703225.1 hypothetical protein KY285_017503 [Solanum tuberosum]